MQYYDFDVICPDLVCRFRAEPPSLLRECKEGAEKKSMYVYICIKKRPRSRDQRPCCIFLSCVCWTWRIFSRLKVDGHSIFQMHRSLLIGVVGQIQHQQDFFFRGSPGIAVFITSNKTTECWALDIQFWSTLKCPSLYNKFPRYRLIMLEIR